MKKVLLFILCSCSMGLGFSQWTELTIPTLPYFNSAYFQSDSLGFLFEEGGKMRRTADGGATWDSIGTSYIYTWLNTADFIDEQTGYVAGGANFPFPPSSLSDLILKTTDGGLTWDSIYSTLSGSEIIDIDFADANNGMFVSPYVSYKTSDAGSTIDTLGLDFNNTLNYGRAIAFPDLNNAYAIAYQNNTGPNVNDLFILKSTNQGDDWQVKVIENVPSNLTHIDFVSGDVGFLIAQGSRFFSTTDGANTWTKLQLDTSLTFTDVKFVDEQLGFLCAIKDSLSYLYTTQDGGGNWMVENIDTNMIAPRRLTIGEKYIFAYNNNQVFKRSIASFMVGIGDSPLKNSFQIVPNPTSDIIQFEYLDDATNTSLKLFNVLGQLVSEKMLSKGMNTIHLSDFDNGVYTLVISDKDKPILMSRVLKK